MFNPQQWIKPLLNASFFAITLGAHLTMAQQRVDIPVKHEISAASDSIVVNTLLTRDKIWILKGFVLVKAGVTLTIESGTTIEGDATLRGVLLVDRGGYLVAPGTQSQPITFQGPGQQRGAWGGIVLLGKATTNQGSLVQFEALPWAMFGGNGTFENDSSGVLTYIRLIGPGFPIAVDRELNGLSLCGVGRRTVLNHIQIHGGDDDGIEWFGGTVNSSHLVVTNAVDDSYDTDFGYTGNSQFMIAIQSVEPPRQRQIGSEIVGDRGIECGSNADPSNLPVTHPIWKNITVIDNGRSGGAFEAKQGCGGAYEKMVLVGGGVDTSRSQWLMNFDGKETIVGISDPAGSYLNFRKTYLTGKWTNAFQFIANPFGSPNGGATPEEIASAQAIVNATIKQRPLSNLGNYGLYRNLKPHSAEIAADSAGAIVGDDLWYQGWTLPGTVDFPLGEANALPYVLQTQPAGGRDSAGAIKLYRPLTWDFGIFQSPPFNGPLNVSASQAFLDGVDYSETFRGGIFPYPTLLGNGDRLYKALGVQGTVFGPAGIHSIRLRLVLLSGQIIDETFYWNTVE